MGERIITFNIWTKRPKDRTNPKYFSDCQINRTIPWNPKKMIGVIKLDWSLKMGAHKGVSKQDAIRLCQLVIEGRRVVQFLLDE